MAIAHQIPQQRAGNRFQVFPQQLPSSVWQTPHSAPRRLAVLIDAENASYRVAPGLFEEVAKYGVACVRRAYGEWRNGYLNGWHEHLTRYAITPVQQCHHVNGKNASDSAMIIDAMDLLYGRRLDAFCLVSSDSDFTRLATRIREAGLTVYGFGEKKTPQAFVRACDRFIYTDILRQNGDRKTQPVGRTTLQGDSWLVRLLRRAVEDAGNEQGWANLAAVGSVINHKNPAFDARSFGYSKLLDLVRAIDLFLIRTDESTVYIRDRRWSGENGLPQLLRSAVIQVSGEDGWAALSQVGAVLRQMDPAFSPERYGHDQLSALVRSLGMFQMEEREEQGLYIRDPRQGANGA